MKASHSALALGGLLAQLASVVDGCDGEVARLKFHESAYGGWFGAVLDRYADAFLLLGLTWYVFSRRAAEPYSSWASSRKSARSWSATRPMSTSAS